MQRLSTNHCFLLSAGVPLSKGVPSKINNGTEFTKVTRIPTPCGSPNSFSPFDFFSATDTDPSEIKKDNETAKTTTAGGIETEQNLANSVHKYHHSWSIHRWFKRQVKPKETSKDDELEIVTGLRRIDPKDVEAKGTTSDEDISDASTLFEDVYQSTNKKQRCTSALYSFINFSKPELSNISSSTINESSLTKAAEENTTMDLETTFSFDSRLEEENFHSVTLSSTTPKDKTSLFSKVLMSIRGSIRRQNLTNEDLAKTTANISYNQSLIESETPNHTLKHKFSLRALFPGYRFSDPQTSVLSGYLAESPHKDLTERYLGDNGIENLETDLSRLENDPQLDIFGRLIVDGSNRKRRRLKQLVKRKSFKKLFSGVERGTQQIIDDEEESWNPYLRYEIKRHSKISCGTTRDSISDRPLDQNRVYRELEDYVQDTRPCTSTYRSLSSGRRQDQNGSLKELIRKKTEREEPEQSPYRAPNMALFQYHHSL